MFRRKLGIICGTMLIFSLISYILITAFGRKSFAQGEEQGMTVLTSFYPVYLITKNLTQGMEGVQVINLTENHSGCLHDYQLTTKDMFLLETADLLIINGGGMELFVLQAADKLGGLTVVDSCQGMELLAGEGHDHAHGEEPEDRLDSHGTPDADIADEAGGDDPDAEGLADGAVQGELAENGHVWMDMDRYLCQTETIADALCTAFPEQEAVIRANQRSYCEKITALSAEYERLANQLTGVRVVTFHDAFLYLCDSLGIRVVHGLDLDADSALSAGEIAELTDEIRLHRVRYLFADKETGSIAKQIAAETGCSVLYLDPLTSGEDNPEAYLAGMRNNLEELKKNFIN